MTRALGPHRFRPRARGVEVPPPPSQIIARAFFALGLAALLVQPGIAGELGTLQVVASPVELLDGNRQFTGDRDYRHLSARDLAEVSAEHAGRKGVVADGVSPLLVRTWVPGPGSLSCAVEGSDNGHCTSLLVGAVGNAPESGQADATAGDCEWKIVAGFGREGMVCECDGRRASDNSLCGPYPGTGEPAPPAGQAASARGRQDAEWQEKCERYNRYAARAGRNQVDCSVEPDPGGSAEPTDRESAAASEPTHIAVAVYHPPESFGPGAGGSPPKYRGEVEVRAVDLRLQFRPADGPPQTVRKRMVLARPPLVLVHGTFDNPDKAWHTAGGGTAFADTMAAAGFRTFSVDYRRSSGAPGDSFLYPREPGTFQANRAVVWANPGGIEEALRHFREELSLAATQADVVGHSLGGLLPRVFASDRYPKPDPIGGYKSKRNFGKGDIHRLITLCTPHRGSALPALMKTLQQTTSLRDGVVEAALASAVLFKSYWEGVSADEGAVMDQLPGSPALERIGATWVPTHALGCVASLEAADSGMDPEGSYHETLESLAWVFYWAPGLLERYLTENGLDEEALALSEAVESRYDYWRAKLRQERVGWLTAPENADLRARAYEIPPLLELFQHLVFLKDENDFTVGLASQLGGLDGRSSTVLRGILHGFAPRYASVQDAVIHTLKHDRGFAAAIDPMDGTPAEPPEDDEAILARLEAFQSDAYETGDQAIRWSGMVASHPWKFLDVAQSRQVLLLYRPVNHDATLLIARDAATKSMPVKPKSADWGPQRGYLTVDQAYSKLAGQAPAKKIAKYNCEAYGNLQKGLNDPGPRLVEAKHLVVTLNQTDYEVYRYAPESSGRWPEYGCRLQEGKYAPTKEFIAWLEDRLVAQGKPIVLLGWKRPDGTTAFKPAPGSAPPAEPPTEENTLPVYVLAHPKTKAFMTADYDLLAIASKKRPCVPPQEMHPEKGAICDWQIQVLDALNAAARTEPCMYDGNPQAPQDLSHHGPENQFPKSPYVDYPITVIEPADKPGEPGRILAIREGRLEGYRDMHLKRYFARMKRRGWLLEPNPTAPGWRWGEYDEATGYDDADHAEYEEGEPPAELRPPVPPRYEPGDECSL